MSVLRAAKLAAEQVSNLECCMAYISNTLCTCRPSHGCAVPVTANVTSVTVAYVVPFPRCHNLRYDHHILAWMHKNPCEIVLP